MKIVYLITKMITCPGAYLKGVWEHMTCRLLGIPVCGRNYLPPTEWCGHAEHEPALTPAKAWLLSFLPFLAQMILGGIFLGASFGPVLIFRLDSASTIFFWPEVIALFLGLSIVCNAFPQWDDAKRMWQLFYGQPEAPAEAPAGEEAPVDFWDTASDDVMDEAPAEEDAQEEYAAAETAPEEDAQEAAEQALPETDAAPAPKFAKLPGKILFAPCNVFFLAGAWLEHWGITTILAAGVVAAALALL